MTGQKMNTFHKTKDWFIQYYNKLPLNLNRK